MVISAYFARIKGIVDLFGTARSVLATEVSFERRPNNQGYLHGLVIFVDNSRLYFKEYVSATEGFEKRSYSYHYQDAHNYMIFRYDNAAHKPVLPYREHKHLVEGEIVQAKSPSLEEVLAEIALIHGWL